MIYMTTANDRLLAERNLARDQAASAALEQAQARVKQLEWLNLSAGSEEVARQRARGRAGGCILL